jgi:hypothetical protein
MTTVAHAPKKGYRTIPFGQKIETLYGKRTWRENLATCHHMETS